MPTSQVSQVGSGENEGRDEPFDEVNALYNNLKVIKLHPKASEKHDLSVFLKGKTNSIIRNLTRELNERKGVKYYLCCQVRLVKHRPKLSR